jgi:hypothetical protein
MFGEWGDSLGHLIHLLVAFLLALPIGWDRARAEHGAGIRTFPLVAMASCGFVQTAISVLGAGAVAQANILQGVVTGVGFVGAGAIMRRQGEATTGEATTGEATTGEATTGDATAARRPPAMRPPAMRPPAMRPPAMRPPAMRPPAMRPRPASGPSASSPPPSALAMSTSG